MYAYALLYKDLFEKNEKISHLLSKIIKEKNICIKNFNKKYVDNNKLLNSCYSSLIMFDKNYDQIEANLILDNYTFCLKKSSNKNKNTTLHIKYNYKGLITYKDKLNEEKIIDCISSNINNELESSINKLIKITNQLYF